MALSVGNPCPLACRLGGQQRTCCAQREFCRVCPKADFRQAPPASECPTQSALRFAALITLPHFSVSSAISLPKSAGEPPRIPPPRSAMRAFSFASASPALISLFSLSTMSACVLRGAATPYQELASKPGRNSLIAETSGKPFQRAVLVTASALTLPVLTYSTVPGALPNRTCTCPPSRSVKAGAIPR